MLVKYLLCVLECILISCCFSVLLGFFFVLGNSYRNLIDTAVCVVSCKRAILILKNIHLFHFPTLKERNKTEILYLYFYTNLILDFACFTHALHCFIFRYIICWFHFFLLSRFKENRKDDIWLVDVSTQEKWEDLLVEINRQNAQC